MITARSVAAEVLQRSRQREAFVSELLDSAASVLSPVDRRLATQLVMGVIRRRATLDAIIAPFLTRPMQEMHPDTLDILRLGAFQMVFLTQIPAHAAVHETVNLAPSMVSRFVNAVLRRVSEIVTEDYQEGPASFAVPIDRTRQRILRRDVFADPSREFLDYFAEAFSYPHWLVERWLDRFEIPEIVRLGFWFNAAPPIWIRTNPLQVTRADYLLSLAQQNMAAQAGDTPQAIQLLEGTAIRDLPGYAEGWFTVQDAASQAVGEAVPLQPGMRVLDYCAAPGGKTTHLAEKMQNQGEIIACDIVPARLTTVQQLAKRLGLSCIQTHLLSDTTPAPAGPFDVVLLDVPCSNTGVLGRRPEVRWRIVPQEFEHLTRLQRELLEMGIGRLKPGGVLIYSTCSIEPEENRQMIQAVLREHRDLRLEADQVTLPGQPSDGGYWARLRKSV